MKEYNISITSRLTGITLHTLRTWEKRYQIVTPMRNQSGHRIYNEKEVQLLIKLNQLCHQGYSISQLKNKKIGELKKILSELGFKEQNLSQINIDENPIVVKRSLDNLILALTAYRLDVVSHEFYNIKMKLSKRELALKIIAPLIAHVTVKIAKNELAIDQEHALSSILKCHLGQFMYEGKLDHQRDGKLFVMTTPEGDYHEFGIILASLLCSHYNQHFFYLGPNMPARSLQHAVKALDADIVILGATILNHSKSTKNLDRYLSDILDGMGTKRKLLMGGSGMFDFEKFKRRKNFKYLSNLNELDHFLKKENI